MWKPAACRQRHHHQFPSMLAQPGRVILKRTSGRRSTKTSSSGRSPESPMAVLPPPSPFNQALPAGERVQVPFVRLCSVLPPLLSLPPPRLPGLPKIIWYLQPIFRTSRHKTESKETDRPKEMEADHEGVKNKVMWVVVVEWWRWCACVRVCASDLAVFE